MREFKTFESDGRFGLIETGTSYSTSCDSLGTGNAQHISRFETVAERAHYVRAEQTADRLEAALGELGYLKQQIRDVLTPQMRVRRKRLLALVDSVREGK